MKKLPISAIILTYNEENNIKDCLMSVIGWVEKVFVVDSYSTDKTVSLAEKMGAEVIQHEFDNYSQQRNWALDNLPVETEWVFNLDADHRVTPGLKKELQSLFAESIDDEIKGFLMSRRALFMGRWIKHGGHYPTYHAPLFRKGFGYCEHRKYDQHFVVQGKTRILKGDIVDIICDSLTTFTDRHNRWASFECDEQLSNGQDKKKELKANFFGNKRQKRRFLRNIYYRSPLFIRSFLYFIYRYFIRLGFLDGKEGLIFHFLQGFWYRFLVDAKLYEIKKKNKRST